MLIPEKGFITSIEQRKLEWMRKNLNELTFNEAVELAQQADQFLADMSAFDPARMKFLTDRRTYWEYAWLLSCEADSISGNDPHIQHHGFLVAYPNHQPRLDPCDFKTWLNHSGKATHIEEFYILMPIYLRPDEVNSYATKMFHRHKDINGWLCDFEIEEIPVER